MNAADPGLIDVRWLRSALDVVLAADESTDADLWDRPPRVALSGTLVSSAGPDYGVLVRLPGARLPQAIVDAEQLHAVLTCTDDDLDAWTTGTDLVLVSEATTWHLPLQPPHDVLAELAREPDETGTLVAGSQVDRLLLPAALIPRFRPHPTSPILEAVHIHRCASGVLTAEAAPHRVAVESRIPVTARPGTDLLLPLRLVDAIKAAGPVASLTLTDSHAIVGAGPRRATVVDATLMTSASVTAWSLTPDGTYPTVDHWLRPTIPATWSHIVSRDVLAAAAEAAAATATTGTHVALSSDQNTEGLVDLVTSPNPHRGATRAGLGSATDTAPEDPQAWCLLVDLQAALRLLPRGDVEITGAGLRAGMRLNANGVTVALATSIPSNTRPHPRSPVTVPID